MRKFLISIFAACACSAAMANSYTATFAVTNAVVMTNSPTIAGWLDHVSVSSPNVSAGTCTVVVAEYDANGTAINTYATVSAQTTSPTLIRTRVMGTSNAGVAITAVTGTAVGTNTTTMLVANYERPMIGGNAKIIITPTGASAGGTVTVTLFYAPFTQALP